MFYQNIRNASAGTSTRGGVSPSGIGYGSQIASIDKLMTQSSMTATGQPLDCAITGDGFFQVQDSDGNVFIHVPVCSISTRRQVTWLI